MFVTAKARKHPVCSFLLANAGLPSGAVQCRIVNTECLRFKIREAPTQSEAEK